MLKMAKESETTIKDDPRTILERSIWQRVRLAACVEVLHPDWGTALYALHRANRLDNDQREAGDRYARLIRDFRKLWRDHIGSIEVYRTPGYDSLDKRSPATADVERLLGYVAGDAMREESEFEIIRARRIANKYREARAVVGPINPKLEDFLLDDVWPAGEIEHIKIGYALTRLHHFFLTGTKRKRGKKCTIIG